MAITEVDKLMHEYSLIKEPISETRATDSSVCTFKKLKEQNAASNAINTFWQKGWRELLCLCSDCLTMYKDAGVGYLTEELDDDDEDEEEAEPVNDKKTEHVDLFSDSQQAFLKMPISHESKIGLLERYNDMSSSLKTFLGIFAASGKEVTKSVR
jgi:E3 ubiquitin-protein ligase UBR7